MLRILLFLVLIIISFSCRKNEHSEPDCFAPTIVPYQPYANPVWHPNGNLLGFNHTPQTGVYQNGAPPCDWYMNAVNFDSAGFYLMNRDGTGFMRVTDFYLNTPDWSPDGAWIAFSIPPNIYKMHFDGYNFDTANIIQLTDAAANFFPCWTANSDTIYFDSNIGTNGQGYYIWKMAADGSGKFGFPNTGRDPYVGSNNRVYYVWAHHEIFSMKMNGTDIRQETFSTGGGRYPIYWQGKVFVQSEGIKVTQPNGKANILVSPVVTFDLSINGEIVYSKMQYDILKKDIQNGTLWIMNADGSNNRQFTYNYSKYLIY